MERREAGLIAADRHTHLVVVRLAGSFALCGGGQIVTRVPGFFDPDNPLACAECVRGINDTSAGR